MSPRLSALAAALVVAASNAGAASDPALTIYRADGDALFDSNGSPIALLLRAVARAVRTEVRWLVRRSAHTKRAASPAAR